MGTKGRIFFRTSLFFCKADFRSVNLTAEVIFFYQIMRVTQGGLATAFDLATFRLSMIAPVKKSVNHPRTVASMRVTGWE